MKVRCVFVFPDGVQCRLWAVAGRSEYCVAHYTQQQFGHLGITAESLKASIRNRDRRR